MLSLAKLQKKDMVKKARKKWHKVAESISKNGKTGKGNFLLSILSKDPEKMFHVWKTFIILFQIMFYTALVSTYIFYYFYFHFCVLRYAFTIPRDFNGLQEIFSMFILHWCQSVHSNAIWRTLTTVLTVFGFSQQWVLQKVYRLCTWKVEYDWIWINEYNMEILKELT